MNTKQDLVELAHEDAEHYRSVVQKMRDAVSLLERYQSEDRRDGMGPDETVKDFACHIGKDAAAVIIASLVNESAWDGRIDPRNAKWALGIEQAFDESAMRHMHIYTNMHMCHLDQIATVMRKMYNGDDATKYARFY